MTDGTSVSITEWKLGEYKLVEDDKFEEGQTYRCYVIVNPEEAFEFPDSISVTINGKDAEIYNKDRNFVTAYYDFQVPIDKIALNVVEPKAGEKPQEASTLTDNTSVSITEWKLGDNKLGEDYKFEEGETYRCYVIVNPEEGFEFPDSISVTINGKDAEIYNKDRNFVTAYSDFVAGPEGNIKISEIEANVEKPIVGASPKQVVISTEGVKHGQTIWRDEEYELKDTDVFEAGKTYRLILSLGAEEGFEFRVSPPAIVRINGEEATVYPEIDKNNLGFYYDFIAGPEGNIEINKSNFRWLNLLQEKNHRKLSH